MSNQPDPQNPQQPQQPQNPQQPQGAPGQYPPPGQFPQQGQFNQQGQPMQYDPNQQFAQGAPPQAQYVQVAKKKKPLLKRVWFWILAIIAVIIIISVASSGDKDDTKKAATPAASSSAAAPAGESPAADAPKSEAPKSEAPKEEAKDPGLNTPVKAGDFTYTITEYKEAGNKVGGEYLNQTAKGKYVAITVTVENTGNEPEYFTDSNIKLISDKKQQFNPDSTATLYAQSDQGTSSTLFAEINPEVSVTGTIYYDVPVDFAVNRAEVKGSGFLDGSEKISLK